MSGLQTQRTEHRKTKDLNDIHLKITICV